MIDLNEAVAEIKRNTKQDPQALPEFDVINAAAVHLQPTDWLWPGMLAKGKLHVFAGRGGMGKTTVMLKIAAIVSTGGYFPDCGVSCDEGNVLYISGEDGPGDTIVPRFVASGGEPERLHLLDRLIANDGEFLSIVEHHVVLEKMIIQSKSSLVIFDPITEFCGGTMDNNSATHVRWVLARLKEIAQITNAAVMCLTHLTKRKDGNQVDQVLGSGAWTHAPRIVWGVAEDESGKYLGLAKSNISPLDHVYPYNLRARAVDGIETFSASIGRRALGEVLSNYTEQEGSSRRPKSVDAADYIRQRLAAGPLEKKMLIEELAKQGISESTVKRAAEEIGVVSGRAARAHGPAIWELPK